MNVQDKIKEMETKRNTNHNLMDYRQWMSEAMPNHIRLQKIQVAGTNGKGSTARWLQDLLVANDWKVGLFTSPHLESHTERIRINDQPISLQDWERIYDQYAEFFKEKEFTMFEMDTWMAIAYFLEQKVDIAIMEVGLGGRLDATTALDYVCTLITNVEMDHQEILGDSIEQITFEKSGVFKPGVVALTTEKKPQCQEVMEHVAGYFQTPLGFVEMPSQQEEQGITFTWNDQKLVLRQPAFQLENLALALECTAVIGIGLKPETIQPVIDAYQHQGRYTIVRKNPLLIVDGAHNLAGIKALCQSLDGFKGTIYFSAMKEKEVEKMIECLKGTNNPIVWVDLDLERSYDANNLNLERMNVETCIEQLENADQPALVCGSLFLAGKVLSNLTK